MKRKYFGTDGIRGVTNNFPMTAEVAMRVGMAIGYIFRSHQMTTHTSRVVIGKDTRISSYMLESAMVAGFTAAGMNVLLLGPIPTPAVSMLCRSMRADLGIMISASHNPYYYNGIKIFDRDGLKLSDEIEHQIEELLENPNLVSLACTNLLGRVKRIEGDIYRYIEFAKRTLPKTINLENIRIVIDCANGAAYKSAPLALWELGAEVITIHNEPDGHNINENCGSTSLASVIAKVKEMRADIGIALDGDGDRVLIIDEKGEVVDGDKILAIIAKNWLQNNKLNNQWVVATLMSNLGLERFLNKYGLQLCRTKVGDRYVAEEMRNLNSNLGGEQSGHIILSEYVTTGDGLIAALQVLACAKQNDKTISELCEEFETVPQILKNIKFNAECKNILEKQSVQKVIQQANEKLGSAGRTLIRKSGTESVIRVMVEGDDKKLIETLCDEICSEIAKSSIEY